ncbi:MAG: ABC transporter substrate-binding protein, partial [Candidatus Dormibacteraceae bacterium]
MLLLLMQACGAASRKTGDPSPKTSGTAPTKVVLATGFPTSMNFAPYYLAQARGYYAKQGLDVTIQDGVNAGLLEQLGRGQIDFGVTSGDSLLLARAAGIPDVMVMQQFTSNPVGAIALASGPVSLATPTSLRGLRVGVSAPNGSTYFGLLALLAAGGLSLQDVDVVS